jgi:hypothetical protein
MPTDGTTFYCMLEAEVFLHPQRVPHGKYIPSQPVLKGWQSRSAVNGNKGVIQSPTHARVVYEADISMSKNRV